MTSPPPPDPWSAGPVPNPYIPDPITVTCTRCERPFVCDATSLAARDHICGPCAVPAPGGGHWPGHDSSQAKVRDGSSGNGRNLTKRTSFMRRIRVRFHRLSRLQRDSQGIRPWSKLDVVLT